MSAEEDMALAWWFGHTRQMELTGTGPVDSLVAMVRDASDARERETIARVVAYVDREIRERDGLHQNEAVQALCSLREELTSGDWRGEP